MITTRKIADATATQPVTVVADPEACSFQFDPVGKKKPVKVDGPELTLPDRAPSTNSGSGLSGVFKSLFTRGPKKLPTFPAPEKKSVTVGAILTLFVSMQATAGVNWTERLKILDLPGPDRLVPK